MKTDIKPKVEDIFSLSSLEDLPQDMWGDIKSGHIRASKEVLNLLSLFDLKKSINTDEMMVGLFRKFNLKKDRKWFIETINRLKKKNLVKKSKNKGFFEKVEKQL